MRPELGVLFPICTKLGLNMFFNHNICLYNITKFSLTMVWINVFWKMIRVTLETPCLYKILRPQRGLSEYYTLHRFWLSISLIPFQSGFHSGLVTPCGIRLWWVYLSISQSNLTFTMHADEAQIRVFVPNQCQICAKHIFNNEICLYKTLNIDRI